MAWFRSAPMEYVSVVVQEHCAHACISKLGRLASLQLVDLNPELTPFQRRYVREISRCEEIDRKLRYFAEQLDKFGIAPAPADDLASFLDAIECRPSDRPPVMDELEPFVEEKEKDLLSLNAFIAELALEHTAKVELRHVLEKSRTIFDWDDVDAHFGGGLYNEGGRGRDRGRSRGRSGGGGGGGGDGLRESLLESAVERRPDDPSMRFNFFAGTLLEADRGRFERMVFRATRGNCFTRFEAIDEPLDDGKGNEVDKLVFVIFYQSRVIEAKLTRICEAFNARRYDAQMPPGALDDGRAVSAKLREVTTEINERRQIIRKNHENAALMLRDIARYLANWQRTVARDKRIYDMLNRFVQEGAGVLRAEGWVIASAKDDVAAVVKAVHEGKLGGAQLPSWVTELPREAWPTPPTHFEMNKFKQVFQDVVDTYGVPRYQEANPAFATAITFPFLFGVMYGDVGHGTLLLLGALLLCAYEKQLLRRDLGEIGSMMFAGRYKLVLMGFFAVFNGFIYNDCFSLGLHLFDSAWKCDGRVVPEADGGGGESGGGGSSAPVPAFSPTCNGGAVVQEGVYPFGIDPMWKNSEQELVFVNSLKMKLSVILGVTHMACGVGCRIANAFHFGSRLDFWFEALPMMVFLMAMFGYMIFLIFYKWCLPNGDVGIITTMIQMALSPGTLPYPKQADGTVKGLFPHQAKLQVVLILVAVAAVPLMLFPKPFILNSRNKKAKAEAEAAAGGGGGGGYDELEDGGGGDGHGGHGGGGGHDDEEGHSFGDLFIHQMIETIEFVLGCVSNTASYLRLWALSLAHSQLAQVFWGKSLVSLGFDKKTSGFKDYLMTFVAYAVFAAITTGVLLLMDVLECYLHGLRLHWVEFQNKFYHADGKKFLPFSFARLDKKKK